jgi:hypothetical protein
MQKEFINVAAHELRTHIRFGPTKQIAAHNKALTAVPHEIKKDRM